MSQVVWKSMKRYGIEQAEEHRYLERSLRFHETLYGALLDRDRQAVEIAYQEHYETVQAVVFDGGSHTE
jgi:DNA-binding FadR family transcriptional regulator